MQAFEMTGTVDAEGQLDVDQPLPIPQAGRVRMIVLVEDLNVPGNYHSTLRTVFLKSLILRARRARKIKDFRKTVRNNDHHPYSKIVDLPSLDTIESFDEDPKIQESWDGLADIFTGDPDEDWNQLLINARRKSQWM